MIIVEKLYPDAQLPQRQSAGAAGYDACAYLVGRALRVYNPANVLVPYVVDAINHTVVLPAGHRMLVPLGFKARLPSGFEAQVRSRSGLVLKRGLEVANQPGTIDSDYTEEWGVILRNASTEPQVIEHGMRVAQIVLKSVTYFPWIEGEVVGERSGFGSTGV